MPEICCQVTAAGFRAVCGCGWKSHVLPLQEWVLTAAEKHVKKTGHKLAEGGFEVESGSGD